ncbi:hypothetical protein, partial [Pseudoalteromonas peptidolytica]
LSQIGISIAYQYQAIAFCMADVTIRGKKVREAKNLWQLNATNMTLLNLLVDDEKSLCMTEIYKLLDNLSN